MTFNSGGWVVYLTVFTVAAVAIVSLLCVLVYRRDGR